MANSFSRWRSSFIFISMGAILFSLSDVGVAFGDLKIILSTNEEFFLLLGAILFGLLVAFGVSVIFIFLPMNKDNVQWSGFLAGLLPLFFY